MRGSDDINCILENRITRREIKRINSTNGISPSKAEGAGASDHRHLPDRLCRRKAAGHAKRAPVELSRRYIKVGVQGNGGGVEVGVGGRALNTGDLLGVDVWPGRDAVVEDLEAPEAGAGSGGDGGVRDDVHGGVGLGAAFEVVDVEMELCDFFVPLGEGLDPRAQDGSSGGCGGKEVGDNQHRTYCKILHLGRLK